MKQFEKVESNLFRWWRTDGEDIKEEHLQQLKETAKFNIGELKENGYTQGTIITEIDGISYRGYWEVSESDLPEQSYDDFIEEISAAESNKWGILVTDELLDLLDHVRTLK